MGLYTNALMGTAMDERHTWTHQQRQGLEQAQERDEDVEVYAHCGQERAIHEAGQPEQHALRLVPVRDLGVETLADFLVHPGTCEVCARTVAQNLGLGWPPEQASARVEDVEDPEYVAKEVHEQRAARIYDERYGEDGEGSLYETSEGEERDAVALEDGSLGEEITVLDQEGETLEAVVVREEGPTGCLAVDDGTDSYTCVPHDDLYALTDEDREWWRTVTGDLPTHPNCRSTWSPQEDERTTDAADALRYATTSYATFVEYGRGDGSDGPPGAGAAPLAQATPEQYLRPASGLTVDTELTTPQGAAERAADHLRQQDVEHSFDVEITLTEDQAEDLRKEMGLADRAARDSR